MTDKWIIYHSDAYYPYVEVYDSIEDAWVAWQKLKDESREDDPNDHDIDYVAKVMDENGEDRRIK